MPDVKILSWQDELIGWAPKTVRFWRTMAVVFCVFSILGHWMEIPYCLFMDWAFNIVEDDSLVFQDPMYPFCVYGIAAVAATIVLVPYRKFLVARRASLARAVIEFYVVSVVASMLCELIMGLLLNQPDPVTGEYPLWDNSYLPGNVLGQAWLVNDLLLGGITTLYVWVLYPIMLKIVNAIPERWGWPVTIIVVVSFVVLCYFKFQTPGT